MALFTPGDPNLDAYEVPSIEIGRVTAASGNGLVVRVLRDLDGIIAVNGAVADANSAGAEILATNALGSTGAIVANYDGYGSESFSGTVEIDGVPYDETDASAGFYIVSLCLGDMNNDGLVDSSDGSTTSGPYHDARTAPATYVANFPGLGGSRVYHADCDQRNGLDPRDNVAFDALKSKQCCATNNIPGDAQLDFDVDLNDLLIVLGDFGCTSAPCSGDVDFDGDTDLDDLLILLANFGKTCGEAPAPITETEDVIELDVQAFDTSGYSGGGFEGEDEHFVFDVLIDLTDTDDDWTASTGYATAANGAAFRLNDDPNDPFTPGNSEPGKYVTFFSVPRPVNAAGRFNNPLPDGGIVGACFPLSGTVDYTTTEIDACWYDNAESNDDGAVMRLVIDVSGVAGADTSGGLGSVYFSTTGPDSGDIKVADVVFGAAQDFNGTTLTMLMGAFYVTD